MSRIRVISCSKNFVFIVIILFILISTMQMQVANSSDDDKTNDNLTNDIISLNTSIDAIKYEQNHPFTITATNDSEIDNLTLYYRSSIDNITWCDLKLEHKYCFNKNMNSSWNLNYPNTFKVVNKIAYIPSINDNALTIFDVSNINNPIHLGAIKNSSYLRGAHDVWVRGNIAYVVNYYGGSLSTFNISDPDDIVFLDEFEEHIDMGMYIFVDENYAYVTSKNNDALIIFNISNPLNISYVSSISGDAARLKEPWHPFKNGNYLYVSTMKTPYDGVSYFDITNVSDPKYVGGRYGGCLRQFVIRDNLLYTLNGSGYALMIFNVANPVNWTLISQTRLNVYGPLDVYGNYVFMRRVYPDNGVLVANISNPLKPVNVTGIYGSGFPCYLEGTHSIIVQNNTLYITAFKDNSFDIIDINFHGMWQKWNDTDNPDISFPWSWNFSFPEGIGYYEFYSIGKKSGLIDEAPPSNADAMCKYSGNTPPFVSLVSPIDSSYDVNLNPVCQLEVNDSDGDKIDIFWYGKVNNQWVLSQTNFSVNASTIQRFVYDQVDEYGKCYWWKIAISDSYDNISAEYYFFTKLGSSSPDFSYAPLILLSVIFIALLLFKKMFSK